MDLWRSVEGMVRVELTSADPAAALMQLNDAGITVFDARREEDDLTVSFYIRRVDHRFVERLVQKKGYEMRTVRFSGIYWALRRLIRRPVLAVGLLLFFATALYVPSRVFFVRVEGNTTVPTRLILEKSEECGVSFGASRRQVRSERVKNALLEAIPQLQWAGVNTYGCVAVISVSERAEDEIGEEENSAVSSIVALQDGVITRCIVTRGNPLCSVGQVVRSGQLLVSGYTDCGICIKAGQSNAEIYAQTQRKLEAVLPTDWHQQTETGTKEKKYALIIGKKRINFYKGSGISGGSCDKMYSQYYVTLPGGFVLPVSIVTEVWSDGSESQTQITEEQSQSVLARFSRRYLPDQMIAGQILTANETMVLEPGIARLKGNYACEEMIAQVQSEEIIKPNGKYD